MADMDWRGGASERSRSGIDSNPYQLTDIELDFLELMAKGFDPMDASRSLGISFPRGAQIRGRLFEKLNARSDNHLRHIVTTVARELPAGRFEVLDC